MAGFDYENLMKKEYLEKINGVEILKDLHFFFAQRFKFNFFQSLLLFLLQKNQ